MNTVLEVVWPYFLWVLIASCKAFVIIALILACRRLFQRWLSAGAKHRLWFALIVCLALPFGATLDVSLLNPLAQANHAPIANEIPAWRVADVADTPKSTSDTSNVTSNTSVPVAQYVVLAWIAVAVGLMMLSLRNLLRYFRVRRQASRVDIETLNAFLHCKAQLNISSRVRILESSAIESPTMFGWWSPTLLLPKGLTRELAADQLRHVFLHELTHVRRWDIFFNWLTAIIQAVHWFNPMVWLGMHVMRTDMEQACDASVMRHLTRTEQLRYGDTLIQLSVFHPSNISRFNSIGAQGVGIVEHHSQLKRRIHMIAQFAPKNFVNSMFAFAVLTVLLFVAMTQPKANAVNQPAVPATQLSKQPQANVALVVAKNAAFQVAKESSQSRSEKTSANEHPRDQPAVSAIDALRSEYFKLVHVKASDLAVIIKPEKGVSLLSEQGYIAIDERTNTLLIRDTHERVFDIQKMVAALDVPVQQILIDTRMVFVNKEFLQSDNGKVMMASLSSATPDAALDAALAAGQSEGKLEIISRPRIVTLNQKEAAIRQGMEIPLATGSGQATLRKTVVSVNMTPRLMPDKRILLDVSATQETELQKAVSQSISETERDATEKDKRQVVTQVVVNDGGGMLLRGLYEDSKQPIDESVASNAGGARELLIILTARTLNQTVGAR